MWFPKFFVGILAAGMALFANVAVAANHNELQAGFRVMGIRETIDWSSQPRRVEVIVDQDEIIKDIPQLKAMGILNPDINQTMINLHPNAITEVVAEIGATMEVMDAYTNSGIDGSNWHTYALVTNDYGNKTKELLFSFTFDRKLYKKINWDNFNLANLSKVAPHFAYSHWYMANMEPLDGNQ